MAVLETLRGANHQSIVQLLWAVEQPSNILMAYTFEGQINF